MGTLFVDKLDPQSGTALEIGSSGDTITIPSGATIANSGTATGFGESNTPAFAAVYSSSGSGLANGTYVKLSFDSELYDSGSVYDTSNYRFTPGVAGKYYVYLRIGFSEHNTSAGSVSDQAEFSARIYKNGSSICHTGNHSAVSSLQGVISTHTSVIADLDDNDYVEAYVGLQNNDVNANLLANAAYNEFGAFRISGL